MAQMGPNPRTKVPIAAWLICCVGVCLLGLGACTGPGLEPPDDGNPAIFGRVTGNGGGDLESFDSAGGGAPPPAAGGGDFGEAEEPQGWPDGGLFPGAAPTEVDEMTPLDAGVDAAFDDEDGGVLGE
jgi:hypothetical protein